MVVVQELSDHDMADSTMIAKNLTGMLSDDVFIITTDEAHFHLSGCVNKQNCCYWGEENSQQLHQWPLQDAYFKVIHFYFFEDKDGRAVTVTSACYQK
jgi:hypothetical protein